MENHATRSNVISIPTSANSRSGLSREFFREKESILIDDEDGAEKEKQKDHEALLKKQLEAREMMRGSWKDGARKSSDRISPGVNPMRMTTDIDKAIANLDMEIRDKRRTAPPAPEAVELDRFGYVVRNTAKTSNDPAELYRSMFPQGENGSRRRKRTRSRSSSPSKRRRSRSTSPRGLPSPHGRVRQGRSGGPATQLLW